ncbi:PREDICTED: uncharacterized protein LOC109587539 [Amphimedon queenslandica]|uniref:G-protein coupled receptors family 1 profile domain-containing protein n=1 Tax=Amphimedon queenslandica TaxID=400682 RepID=A0A1X7TJ00_AMPQE|nr:PREDICTED: uncharacterized protein LOC109587539 [Amphimedon queenslandica]|eukprot:XP_019859336.1 PREDICTED: uncharacterized protein LOC109587539 [Amphimedon queenslandica]
MQVRFLLLSTLFFFLLPESLADEGAGDGTCINNYSDLLDALRDREADNVRKLLDAFYPPDGGANVNFLDVAYCISNSSNECTVNYTYYWADSSLLLVVEPQLLNILSLYIIRFGIRQVTLNISPTFCSDDISKNKQLLKTLTAWLKGYAIGGNDEQLKGYVRYYESGNEFPTQYYELINVRVNILITYCLLTVVINVFLVLSFRVCSGSIRKRIDKAIKIAVSTATSGISGEGSDMNQTPFLESISSPAHNVFYVFAIILWSFYDSYNGYFVSRVKYNTENWLVFLPVPIIVSSCFIVSFFIPTVIKCMTCAAVKNDGQQHIISQIVTVSLLTVLSAFAVFHGFWIAIIFAVYPGLVLSKILPLIPMYLPAMIIYRRVPYFIRRCSKLVCRYENRGQRKRDAWVMIAAMFYTIFIYVVTWLPILALIDYVSYQLNIITMFGNDPIELMIIVAVVSIITYRLAIILIEVDQRSKTVKKEVLSTQLDQPDNDHPIELEEVANQSSGVEDNRSRLHNEDDENEDMSSTHTEHK